MVQNFSEKEIHLGEEQELNNQDQDDSQPASQAELATSPLVVSTKTVATASAALCSTVKNVASECNSQYNKEKVSS